MRSTSKHRFIRGCILGVVVAMVAAVCAAPAGASSAYTWGSYYGGAPDEQISKTLAPGLTNPIQVEPSNSSTYFLDEDGSVWAEGNNEDGQLGNGTTESSPFTPVRVGIPAGVFIVALAQAKNSGFAITSTGHVWAWGLNEHGVLCLGNKSITLTPKEVPGLTGVVEGAGGGAHSIFRLSNGTVDTCGTNQNGQLGVGKGIKEQLTPVQVPGLSEIVEIGAGSGGALQANGELHLWGGDTHGEECNGVQEKAVYTPEVVATNVESFSKDGDSTANGDTLLLKAGEMYGCGADKKGGVGDGGGTSKDLPTPTGQHYVEVTAGAEYGHGVDAEGNVFAWGAGAHGVLGTGNNKTQLKPVLMDSGVSSIASTAERSGDIHTV